MKPFFFHKVHIAWPKADRFHARWSMVRDTVRSLSFTQRLVPATRSMVCSIEKVGPNEMKENSPNKESYQGSLI